MERLVAGRERIYLDRFWKRHLAGSPKMPAITTRSSTPCQALCIPGSCSLPRSIRMRLTTRRSLPKGKLAMPVLARGGEKSFGKTMAEVMRFAATDVQAGAIPDSGHRVMEENPNATIALFRAFLTTLP